MKLGLPLLITGVALLLVSIPLAIAVLVRGFNNLTIGDISGGVLAWTPLATVILGLVLTTIGASRVFKN